jgi:hypothetical protein
MTCQVPAIPSIQVSQPPTPPRDSFVQCAIACDSPPARKDLIISDQHCFIDWLTMILGQPGAEFSVSDSDRAKAERIIHSLPGSMSSLRGSEGVTRRPPLPIPNIYFLHFK